MLVITTDEASKMQVVGAHVFVRDPQGSYNVTANYFGTTTT
jgi:hypothetical protein